MPSKPRDPRRTSVYLDQSTLSDAFRGATISASHPNVEPQRRLLGWVHDVATRCDLCLSQTHVIELAAWHEPEAMAVWLDSLDVVWLYSFPEVQRAEDEHAVRIAAGLSHPTSPRPFAPSFLSSFGDSATLESTIGMLDDPTIVAAVRGAARRVSRREREFMPDYHRALREDRDAAAASGVSEAQLRAGLESNRRAALRRRAGLAHGRLVDRNDHEYIATGATFGSVQDPLVELYERDMSVMRTTRVIEAYSRGFERETALQKPGSNSVKKRHASALLDLAHAGVAAAYCDVFNCDDHTARCLGDVRTTLGLAAPIARQRDEDDGAFVARLLATVP